MKLRIKGDSLRLRVSPSEMSRLLESGRVAETIHFGPGPEDQLTYALEHAPQAVEISVRSRPQEVAVIVSTRRAQAWARGAEVGIYGESSAGTTSLELAVEKDFACLDKPGEENLDTFPNPNEGAIC
jgi:hypothetical protein